MSEGYSFPTGVEDGFQVELENGVTYEFKAEFKRWDVVKGTGNSVWITDELPDEQYTSNGDLWFDNTEDTMQLFLYHEESDAWLPVAPPTTLEGRVDAGEATQQAIIAQIQESLVEQETLKNKVNALEGVLGEHSFNFTASNKNPRPGEFALLDGGMNSTNSIDSADYIALSDVDANGKDVNLDRVVENDVIRMGSIEGGSAELRVTSSTGGLFQFERISGDLNRLSEMPHDFVLLSSFDPAGLATIEYVDAQDEALSAMITQNGNALKDKVSKSGNQNLDSSRSWKLKQQKQDGGDSTFVSINDGEMNLYHVATPSSPSHAANMQYVDDKVAAIPEPDLSGYATEQYVDDQIAAIPAPSEAVAGPASLCWEWRNYDSLFDPGEGKAAWYSSSECYRLNMKTANGADLAKNSIATKDQSFSGNMPHGAIWTYVGGGWQLVKMFDISRIQWNKTDCIFIYPSTTKFGANNFTAGQKYYFTVGGFF